ncbi:MAG: hypothetical protein M3313_09725 [Actinomycetota bacterium]|nr:hypothetical protein [Actinomycetota bacterium]
MSASAGQPAGGPAQEARRLVEALGEWASSRLGAAEELIATGASECQVCPVCQLISALRGDRTEALTRLNDAWTAFLAVLTASSGSPSTASPAPDVGRPERAEPTIRPVQSIDVR